MFGKIKLANDFPLKGIQGKPVDLNHFFFQLLHLLTSHQQIGWKEYSYLFTDDDGCALTKSTTIDFFLQVTALLLWLWISLSFFCIVIMIKNISFFFLLSSQAHLLCGQVKGTIWLGCEWYCQQKMTKQRPIITR